MREKDGDPATPRTAKSSAGSCNNTAMPVAEQATGAATEIAGDDSSSDADKSGSNSNDTEADDSFGRGHCRALVRTAGTDDAANSGGERNGPRRALAPVSGGCLLIPRRKRTSFFGRPNGDSLRQLLLTHSTTYGIVA